MAERTVEQMCYMENPNPTCGSCGKPLSQHLHEVDGAYCNEITNGDVFIDQPSDETLCSFLAETDPKAFDKLIDDWRSANGHV